MATASVFAKQFAGRGGQQAGGGAGYGRASAGGLAAGSGPVAGSGGGRGGGAKAAPGAGKAPSISAPARTGAPGPARQKAGGAAPSRPTVVKAAVAAKPPATAEDDDEEDEGPAGGGVVTCANRNLLRQMLEGVVEDDEDDRVDEGGLSDDGRGGDDQFQMSVRFVPGTPKPGGQRQSVPTIQSPASIKARSTVTAAPVRGVATKAPPPAPAPKVVGVTAASVVSAVRTSGAVPASQTIATGPPQQLNIPYVSAPRPGSRGACGGGAPPPLASPANQNGAIKRISIAPGATRSSAGPSGYAGLHAQRGKQPPSPAAASTAAKPAPKPLSGPKAFEMLRQMDQGRPPEMAKAPPKVKMPPARDAREESGEEEDAAFVMPPDSEAESEASSVGGDRTQLPARPAPAADPLPGRPRPAPLSRKGSAPPVQEEPRPLQQAGQPARSSAGSAFCPEGGDRAEEQVESAAAYVERMKRDLQLPGAAAPPAAVPAAPSVPDSPASSAVPSGRARSSDPARPAVLGPRDSAPTGVRARSGGPRAAAASARAAASSDDEESDDDDVTAPPPAGGVPAWKADVKQLVQDFAKQERSSRPSRPRAESRAESAPQRRPPRAPFPAASSPAGAAIAGSSPADRRRAQAQAQAQESEDPRASRKPRIVEYTPATVDDYKNKYGQEVKMGALGPDLDDEKLLIKKAVAEKVKQFSKELHRINSKRSSSVPPKPAPKAEPKPTARSKALEFAKELPKPKSKPKAEKQADAAKAPTEADLDRADWEEIRQREIQHFEDVARAQQIKDFLGQLPF